MSINLNKKLKISQRNRLFANRTFDDFQNELLRYAQTNFQNVNTDFSDSSLGGMLLNFAAMVGESTAFYIEQQVNEINYETAVQDINVQKHLRRAGIDYGFSTPSTTYATFFIEVDVDSTVNVTTEYLPDESLLPIVKKGTILQSNSGINFVLEEDVDFRNNYEIDIGEVNLDGIPITLVLSKKGIVTSGMLSEEVFVVPQGENNFVSIELSNENITEIISVIDEDANEYYQVEYLTQDTVFKKRKSLSGEIIEVNLAPYRFVVEKDNNSLLTTLRFGNGENRSLIDDILTNPEDFSLPIKGRNYIEKSSLDPNKLLNSNTLGISPEGKTLIVNYRYGGGINHNIPEQSINEILDLKINFPNLDSSSSLNEFDIEKIKDSLVVINYEESTGGSNPLSVEDLKNEIPNVLKMQNRIVNTDDLLARVYTMPSNFGRVHRATIMQNKYAKGSKDLYILSKNQEGHYINSSDGLKLNLRNYLNEFRLIGDSLNILDVPIFNFGINLVVKVKSGYDITEVLNNVQINLNDNLRLNNLQINEPLNTNDIMLVVMNTEGISSILTDKTKMIVSKSSINNMIDPSTQIEIEYSDNYFDPIENYYEGEIYSSPGGIFELKYPQFDIKIRNS